MRDYLKFYIDGQWVEPGRAEDARRHQPGHRRGRSAVISLGSRGRRRQGRRRRAARVRDLLADHARGAHRAARARSRGLPEAPRRARRGDLAGDGRADVARQGRAGAVGPRPPHAHARSAEELSSSRERRARRSIVREPVGVCGFITPWNWPVNQITCKVAPALAAGCTMVLKPTRDRAAERASSSREILHEAGVPAGRLQPRQRRRPDASARRSPSHPGIDMVSFTGSTRAGIQVAQDRGRHRQARRAGARRQVANIILDDADLERGRRTAACAA